jgi:hypothetical protein
MEQWTIGIALLDVDENEDAVPSNPEEMMRKRWREQSPLQ